MDLGTGFFIAENVFKIYDEKLHFIILCKIASHFFLEHMVRYLNDRLYGPE